MAKYQYENYKAYLEIQRHRAQRTTILTRRKSHEMRRQWIYDYLKDHNIDIEGHSILCLGSRHSKEVEFFIKRGHDAIGIDLYNANNILNCDMSKMYEHPKLKDMRFDTVFSIDSLEHCYDLKGMVKGLELVCKKYFVSMFGIMSVPVSWDCHRFDFLDYVGTDKYDEELIKAFPGFELIVNEVLKKGTRGFFVLRKKENEC